MCKLHKRRIWRRATSVDFLSIVLYTSGVEDAVILAIRRGVFGEPDVRLHIRHVTGAMSTNRL